MSEGRRTPRNEKRKGQKKGKGGGAEEGGRGRGRGRGKGQKEGEEWRGKRTYKGIAQIVGRGRCTGRRK